MSLRDLYEVSVELTRGEEGYPAPLLDLSDPPGALRVVGTLPDFSRAIAIVGTRRADDEGLEFAHRLAADLARRGWVIVSGGARGIDRAAHEGALEAGGETTVVLPTGVADAYPSEHHSLFRQVITSGCLLTEAEEEAAAQPGRFLSRNRLIAALGRSTIVVQAPLRSGALSTARVARKLSRRVFAVPAAPWDPRGQGCLALLEQGARVCVGVGDVLSIAAVEGRKGASRAGRTSQKSKHLNGLDNVERQIFDCLKGRPRHPDEVAVRTGIAVWKVQRSMLRLTVQGLVEERPGGRYARRRLSHGSQGN